MSSTTPSPSLVLEAFDTLGPPGTPVTTTEVADKFDCTARTIYNKLEALVEEETLETKKVGARGRIWWQPLDTIPVKTAVSYSDRSRSVPRNHSKENLSSIQPELPRSERLYQEIFNEIFQFVGVLKPDGTLLEANDAALSFGGFDREDAVGKPFWDAPWWQLSEHTQSQLKTAIDRAADGEFVRYDVEVQGAERTAIIDFSLRPVTDDQGAVTFLIPEGRDITGLKRREYRLEQQRDEFEAELAEIFERISDGFIGLDENFRFTYINDHAESLTEIEESSVRGHDIRETITVTDKFETAIQEALEGQEQISIEEYYEPFNAWFETTVYPSDTGVSVYFRDITERKQRDQQLEQYQTIVETVTDGIIIVDTDSRIQAANEALVEMTSYSRESLIGAPASLIRPDDLSPVMNQVQTSLDSGTKAEIVETMIQPADADPFPSVTHFSHISLKDGTPGRVGVIRDVSVQLEQEQALEESERRYRTLVENSPDMIDTLNSEGTLLDVNQRLCKELGYTEAELVGKGIWEIDQSINADGVGDLLSDLSVDEPITFDARYQRRDGSTFPVEVNLVRLDLIGQDRFIAISRDISERLKREEELGDRIYQQEIVTEISNHALEGGDLDRLMLEAVEFVAEALDNDYCKVLDLDAEAEELLLRQGIGWDEGIAGSATVSSIEDESQAALTLASHQPIKVEDLDTETRFSGPELLTSHGVRSGISTIIGSHENPWGILGTHDTESKEISDYDVNFVQSVANILATAINRKRREQTLHHQREQLRELNNINEVVLEITDAVINQPTREEIEDIVCKRLAEADSYEFAWIGEIDIHTQTVTSRTEAGVTGYLENMTISVRADDPKGQGPGGKAARTKQMQVIHDAFENPEFEPFHDHADQYDYRSVAAIPISYEGTLYGLLGVYANRPAAFDGEVHDVITRLGEIVGHAIAATEHKQALMSPELTEIQYVISNILDSMDIRSDNTGTIRFNRVVPIGDDTFLEYGTVDEEAIEILEIIVDQNPHAEEVTITNRGAGTVSQFELRESEPPIISNVASCGGHLQQTKIENGDLHMTIHLPTTVSARPIIDVIHETYPTATLMARRQIKRSEDTLSQIHRTYTEDLTERQRSALETAVYSGFFEWPRNASGADLADSLGISAPTFHQHLRLAQKKVFESLLLYPSTE